MGSLLWTGPRRVCMLSYSSARLARRVAGHRASSVMQHSNPAICDHLLGLYQYEIANGNTVSAIAPSHGFRFAIRFNVQLKVWGTPATGEIPKPVRYWDSGDAPERGAGFVCPEHQHAVIGPTVD